MKILFNANYNFDSYWFQEEDDSVIYKCDCLGNIDNCRCYSCDDKG